jgi:hypothetical protein
MIRTRRALVALVASTLGSHARIADADQANGTTTAACYDAHEAGQLQRKRGELRKARGSFATCGAPSCPSIVQRDCVVWAGELAAQQPSIVIAVVQPDGKDVLGARVSVDGTPVTADGRAIELDPGEHRVHVEARSEAAVEQRVTVHEGERARRLSIVVGSARPPLLRSGPPTVSWILGGVAVLSLASFGTFAALGKSDENELGRTCGDRCSDDQVAGVQRSYVVADVSLGVAVVAAGAAIVTWVFFPERAKATPRAASF